MASSTFLLAATAQTVATTMQAAALGKQIFDITDSTLALGLLGLFEFLPALVLLPLTGSAADRFDRRRVASIAMAAEVLTSILYFAYAATEPDVGDPDLRHRPAVRHRPRVRGAVVPRPATADRARIAGCRAWWRCTRARGSSGSSSGRP